MLYIVSTPIGNLEDITLRALKTLFLVDFILCEDTRKTFQLLKHFQKPDQKIPELISYFEENELKKIPEIITRLKSGQEIALVSNSGTPTISDPGFKLVRECLKEDIQVVSIPGPSAVLAALAASGLPTDKFIFLGFPPSQSSHRIKLFDETKKSLDNLSSTVIFFESPFRILKSLADLKTVFGDIEIVIAREITKIYEEFLRAKISSFEEAYKVKSPKGEFVILFHL